MSNYDSIFLNMILKGMGEIDTCGIISAMVDPSVRPIHSFIVQHYNKYNKVPSRVEVKKHFPNFRFISPKEPFDYYIKEITKNYKLAAVRNILSDGSEALSGDKPEEAIKVILEGSKELSAAYNATEALNFWQAAKTAIEDIANKEFISAKYSFGSPVLDRDLIGINPGEWALIAGTAKAGKTWVLLKWAYELAKSGTNILFISLELSKALLVRRLYSIIAKAEYGRLRRGLLTSEEKTLLELESNKKRESRFDILSMRDHDFTEGHLGSVEVMQRKIKTFKPDILCVDGIYLGMDNSDWSSSNKFANDFHAMLQCENVPAFATTQLKNIADTSKPQLRDLAFTSAFQQATDFVFLLAKSDEMRQNNESVLTVGAAREMEDCQKYSVKLRPGAEIELSPITAEEVVKNYCQEGDDDDNKKGKKRRKQED